MAKLNLNGKRKAHARRRFDERYGIKCDDALMKKLVEQIQSGETAQFICVISNRVTAWNVLLEAKYIPNSKHDQMIPVLYDKASKIIITALPPESREVQGIDVVHILEQEDVT